MPGLTHKNDQFLNNTNNIINNTTFCHNGFWSKHRDDVSFNQLQKFWSELSPQARQELLKIDKQTLFEQARKNMYCSRCNGLLLQGFLQIVMYGKSLHQEGAGAHLPGKRQEPLQNGVVSNITNGFRDDVQDPSIHPWGGLTTTRDGILTLLDCYLYSKSLKGLQNVFDSARARERERELLYPDACGGGGRGWISQGMATYGRGHGTRETCTLHTARLSCDTLVDFWSALGEETQYSLLRMKEEDFIERLMYRFDSKRFCRDCRRNVIREFKELKELKRMRRETRCTSWFCVADSAFQYEVSDNTVHADWHQTFTDTIRTYHHFEWAIGTAEGKSDILEFENVGMSRNVQVNGLDLGGLSTCYITVRAWKLDGRCTELSVKAHALKGQQCVHCRLVVGDGFISITRGENIRRFFEHAEEAEEEEDDDSMDRDGNELDEECSRPQKHAKSPELAREFLLDAATVIFKEQVEKAFREGTARQNAHSIFVCLALKLLEERVHVACKEIITLERQTKLLEEEEREKREEEERKERRRTKEREKKLRRKERLKGKGRDTEKSSLNSEHYSDPSNDLKEESSISIDEEPDNTIYGEDYINENETGDIIIARPLSPDIQQERCSDWYSASELHNHSYDVGNEESAHFQSGNNSFTAETSKFSRRRLKFRRDLHLDSVPKRSDRRRFSGGSESFSAVGKYEPRSHNDNFETHSMDFNGLNRQYRINGVKSNSKNYGCKYGEKFHSSGNRMGERYDSHSCNCSHIHDSRAKVEPHISALRSGREAKGVNKSASVMEMSKQFHRGTKYNQSDYMHESCGRSKSKITSGNNPSNREFLYTKKVWEPMESQKKYPRSNSDSDVLLNTSSFKADCTEMGSARLSSVTNSHVEVTGDSSENNQDVSTSKESKGSYLTLEKEDQNNSSSGMKNPYCSVETADKEVGLTDKCDPIRSSSSTSDNCSSCISEWDSNTASSNPRNLESSSTSDSEDSSQQSEGKETSQSVENGFVEFHEVRMENKPIINGEGPFSSNSSGIRLDCVSDTKSAPIFEDANTKMGSHHQGTFPPLHNHHMHFPMLQSPSTVGYYHPAWSATPANGLMAYPHPNHYLFSSPLGYGLNGNTGYCMQYGGLPNIPTPLLHTSQVPVYRHVSKSNGVQQEEQVKTSMPGLAKESPDKANKVRVFPAGALPEAAPNGDDGKIEDSAKKHTGNNSFSLFHFGGPVALSTSLKEGNAEDFSSNNSAVHVVDDHACYKKETTIEEYNLFAASNGLRFSFF